MRKRGSVSEWIIMVFIILLVGAASVFISSSMTYSKGEIDKMTNDVKAEAIAEIIDKGYTTCEPILLREDNSRYKSEFVGRTPRQICSSLGKEIVSLEGIYSANLYTGQGVDGPCDYRRLGDGAAFGTYNFGFYDLSFDEPLVEPDLDSSEVMECLGGGSNTNSDLRTTEYLRVFCC